MLYQDAEKRINELTDIANLIFKDLGFPKTAQKILALTKILEMDKVPQDFFLQWRSIFDVLQEEFATQSKYLQAYRREYFKEISGTIVNAILKMPQEAFLVIRPFGERLRNAMRIISDISDGILREEIKDKATVFHLFCYKYLIVMEGILDELARLFYFFATAPNSRIQTYQDLEEISIWEVRNQVNPIFLRKIREWKHVRNAIGHARTYFDYAKDRVRFVDVKKTKVVYDQTLDVSIFVEIELELEGVLAVFYLTWVLLNVYSLVVFNQRP